VKRTLLVGLFITALVLSNVVAGKVLDIYGLIVPGAFILYALTFLATDVISELYGKAVAKQVILTGFLCSLAASGLIFLTGLLPVAEFARPTQEAYMTLLGQNWRFVLASMVAYYASQSWDVWVFHKIGTITGGRHKWLRNNASTMTSQAIDTVLFITIAFAGKVPDLGWMIASQYIVKLAVAAVDTPVFYLVTWKAPSVFRAGTERA
jgi:hypothetical protein